jgi:hypothetical protein
MSRPAEWLGFQHALASLSDPYFLALGVMAIRRDELHKGRFGPCFDKDGQSRCYS